MDQAQVEIEALIGRLSVFVPFGNEERSALRRLCAGAPRWVRAKADLHQEGERLTIASILLSGWACRLMTLPDGRRQIAGFVLPGDICRGALREVQLDHSITALTDCVFLQVNPGLLDSVAADHPALAEAFAAQAHVNDSIQRNWILSLGQRNAFERIGHLFCELLVRLRDIGQSDGGKIAFPVTQIELAEATGLTPVHVNRTLQDMRARHLVSLHNRELQILDVERLADLVMFDSSYLHPAAHERSA